MKSSYKFSALLAAGVLILPCNISIAAQSPKNTKKIQTAVKSTPQSKLSFPIIDNNHLGFIDLNGKITKTNYEIPYIFDEEAYSSDGLYAFLDSKGYMGYMDSTGKIIIRPQYQMLGTVNDGMIMFRTLTNGGQFLSGFMDKTGKVIVKPQYKFVNNFSNGLARVFVNDTDYGYINKVGKLVIAPQFKAISVTDGVGQFNEGMAVFRDATKNPTTSAPEVKWGFIDSTGRIAVKAQYQFVWQYTEGLARVQQNNLCGFIDKKGNEVVKPQFMYLGAFSQGKAFFKNKDTAGYIDKTGKIIISFKLNGYQEMKDFSENLVAVQINGKWGYMDEKGKTVIKPDYDSANNFSEGLSAVTQKNLWGVIDKAGKVIVKPQYRYIYDYKNGVALAITKDSYWTYINKSGKVIWKSSKPLRPQGM